MAEWIAYGALSALLPGLSPACLKAGARRTAPAVGALLYTAMLLLFLLGTAAAGGPAPALAGLPVNVWGLIALAGTALGISYMCLFRSLSAGRTNKVVPISNLSLIAVTLFPFVSGAAAFSVWKGIFLMLIVLGTVLMESRDRRAKKLDWLLFAAAAMVLETVALMLSDRLSPALGADWSRALICAAALALTMLLSVFGGALKTLPGMRAEGFIFPLLAGTAAGLGRLCRFYSAAAGDWGLLVPLTALTLPAAFLSARLINGERASGANVLGLLLTVGGMVALTLDMAVFSALTMQ